MYGLAPDKSVTVGVCLHFCSISESYIQTYKPFRHEELYNGGENCLQHILQTTAVETVDGVMIRSHIAGKPHETDVIAAELFYATAGIDITQISIDKNLKHHVWVVRRTAFSGILTVKFFKVYLFNDTVNNPDRIVLGNKQKSVNACFLDKKAFKIYQKITRLLKAKKKFILSESMKKEEK